LKNPASACEGGRARGGIDADQTTAPEAASCIARGLEIGADGRYFLSVDSFFRRFRMSNLIPRGSLFDDFFKDMAPGFFIKPLHGDPLPQSIRVDVKENGDAYVVEAEMPGVAKEDIHVTIDGSVVTLRAEVKQMDAQTTDEKLLRSERYYGSVARSFQLPVDIDEDAAKAKFDNGVLVLTLPKKKGRSGQRLSIE
jgi:HSP20 family protein